MEKEIFKKKSMERISSPEKMDDYIKTVNIHSWMIVIPCFLVLIVLIVWGVVGKIEISQKTVTVSDGNEVICFIGEKDIDKISEKTVFHLAGKTARVKYIYAAPTKVSETMTEYAAHVGSFHKDDWVYSVLLTSDLYKGIYETNAVIYSISPISLLMK